MNLIGIDKDKGCDYTAITFNNGSEIKAIHNNESVRGLRSKLLLVIDKEYDKYQKRVKK
ncbi:TPA: hypothetical protein LA460_000324 [Clostridium botulinum]|nr:hypothetical protein [Clostridium botulinum]HBJ1652928.1 hypothetical protein [Clostridium botulinum]